MLGIFGNVWLWIIDVLEGLIPWVFLGSQGGP